MPRRSRRRCDIRLEPTSYDEADGPSIWHALCFEGLTGTHSKTIPPIRISSRSKPDLPPPRGFEQSRPDVLRPEERRVFFCACVLTSAQHASGPPAAWRRGRSGFRPIPFVPAVFAAGRDGHSISQRARFRKAERSASDQDPPRQDRGGGHVGDDEDRVSPVAN